MDAVMLLHTTFNRSRAVSHLAAAAVALVGAGVVLTWAMQLSPPDIALLRGITVKTNTGICLLLSGVALWMLLESSRRVWAANVARGASALVVAIAVLTLSEHFWGWDLGIDQLFFHEPPGELATTSPNRMGLPACICFTLAGMAILLLVGDTRQRSWRVDLAAAMAMTLGFIALLPTMGYLYGASQLYAIAGLTGIALPTAVTFMILSAGILTASQGGRFHTLLTSNSAGGVLIRRLLWPALFLPPLLGYLRTLGEGAGFYDAPFGRAILITSFVILFTGLVLWSGHVLDRIDYERSRATRWLGSIVESSEDAIVAKTLQGIVTSWNPSAERVFGYTAKEMIGQSVLKIIPPEGLEEEAQILARLKAGERVEHFETIRVAKDGRRLQISLTISPIKDPSGIIIGASKIARDITQEKERQAEREAILAAEHAARRDAEQASRMKDEFLATLSHELRTPLSAILGWSQLLRRTEADPRQLEQGLDTIERNARMQTQLIEDLLDMSGIISGKVRLDIQSVDPIVFVEAAIETVMPSAQAKGIRIEKILDPAAGPISGDPNRLQQVVWNLLSNAIKFTPRDGKVQVVLQRVNSHIELIISDTGMGIRPEFLPHVFERFRQADSSSSRKHAGLGLGLAIVKQLVELHGGSVLAASEGENKGTSFTVFLPLTVVRQTPEDPHRRHPDSMDSRARVFRRSNLAGLTILVVDDEPDARELVRRVLEECEAKVITAGSADEALRLLADIDRPNVLVSDIGMPEMDGYELLRRIRATDRGDARIPAIALTAFARSEDRTRALRAGFLVHIAKPVEPSELVATVASVSGRSDDSESS